MAESSVFRLLSLISKAKFSRHGVSGAMGVIWTRLADSFDELFLRRLLEPGLPSPITHH